MIENVENRASVQIKSLTTSEKRLLGILFKSAPLTQSAIADATGLTQQSASRLALGLLERGFLVEGEKVATGRRGYPSATFLTAANAAYSVGVSIKADAVDLALMDFTGRVAFEKRQGFVTMPVASVIEWINAAIGEGCRKCSVERSAVVGAGVGVTGSHMAEGGYNTPYSLEEWAGRDIAGLLEPGLGMSVWSDNDGNVAALGENMIGVGKWAKSFAYFYLATGVGGGVILDGELWVGRMGNAGEFAGGLPPNIYPFPNLELLRHLVVKEGLADLPNVNALVEGFDPSWPVIEDWIARVRESVSIMASNATAILDLDAIVLGGLMPRPLAERLIPHIQLYDQRRRSIDRPMAKIVPAEAQGDAAAIGAALLPFQHIFFA